MLDRGLRLPTVLGVLAVAGVLSWVTLLNGLGHVVPLPRGAQIGALVDKAAATAETRLKDAEALIGRLGLNPGRFVAQSSGRFTRTGTDLTAGTLLSRA